MQLPPLTRDQVRRVDRIAMNDYGMPGIVLMENAGRNASEVIARMDQPGRITILCGSGNNAGDGYVIARHLQVMGRQVEIISVVDPDVLTGDAAINATIALKARIELTRVGSPQEIEEAISDSETLVDALLGTGARGAPRGLYRDAIHAANRLECLKIAIDIPTGLDCDTGQIHDPTFRADHTVTFVARKVGMQKKNADGCVGVLHEVGIGIPQKLVREVMAWPASAR